MVNVTLWRWCFNMVYNGYFILFRDYKSSITSSPVQTYYSGTESLYVEDAEFNTYAHCAWVMVF
jgi:hypothetical protein